jgi:hypothetical protein
MCRGMSRDEARQAFLSYVEKDINPARFLSEGREATQRYGLWLLDQLWNCSEVLPDRHCRKLGIPRGSSYAQAVRAVIGTSKG